MSKSGEFYRVTLSNNQIVELQKDDIDVLQKALQDEEVSRSDAAWRRQSQNDDLP